jgi:hypothetical protein
VACSPGGDGGRKPVWGRIANARSIGWAIYAVGFAIWLFGYLSAGHAALFDWKAATPWWISSFVPNLEAELGLALMFCERDFDFTLGSHIPLRGPSSLHVRDPSVVRVFGVVVLACDLGTGAYAHKRARGPGSLRGVQLTASRESYPKNSD